MHRIGIFGGSFDPIHQGHLGIALYALDQLKLDQVYFVPAACSPFKREKDQGVSDVDRLAMTRLAIESLPKFSVSAWELEQGGVSYTVDTLRHFKREHPGSTFFLLMGQDSYKGLKRWKNSDEIQRMARIVVAPRTEVTNFSRDLAVQDENSAGEAPTYLKMPLCDASSTQLRVDLSQTREKGLASLPEAVRQYICDHELYQQH